MTNISYLEVKIHRYDTGQIIHYGKISGYQDTSQQPAFTTVNHTLDKKTANISFPLDIRIMSIF